MAGSSLEEEDEGQALSFSQRSLLKVSVTRGRFSQSQCLGTLCLKREEEEEPRGKRDRSFLVFLLFFFLKAYIIPSGLSSGMDKSRSHARKYWVLLHVTPRSQISSPETFVKPTSF